jgi:hypothetical protein
MFGDQLLQVGNMFRMFLLQRNQRLSLNEFVWFFVGNGASAEPYGTCRTVQNVMHGSKRNLIETIAEDIAQGLLKEQAKLTAVEVAVHKPHVSIPGHFEAMGVKIFRRRQHEVRIPQRQFLSCEPR